MPQICVRVSEPRIDAIEQLAADFGVDRCDAMRGLLPEPVMMRAVAEVARLQGRRGETDNVALLSATVEDLFKSALIARMVEDSQPVFALDYEIDAPTNVAGRFLKWSEAKADALGIANPDGTEPRFMLAQYPAGGEWETKGAAGYWRVLPKGQGLVLTPDGIGRMVGESIEKVSPFSV